MPERIEKVTEPEDSWLEGQKLKLRQMIESDEHLRALTQIINNKHYSREKLQKSVEVWNQNHTPWEGAYVEEIFTGPDGKVLKIMLDRNGNVRLYTALL